MPLLGRIEKHPLYWAGFRPLLLAKLTSAPVVVHMYKICRAWKLGTHRDIFIYDLQDSDTLLGGLVLTAGVTNANFYAMVDIITDVSPPPGHFILQDDNGETVAQDTQPLLPRRYLP
ncbi:hypothetical protein B0T25DRAFT_605509 [Lasiosphaeria hispida]|uniref:DUF7881 domain-containing protein n=1 Tax=Lasiosphaeria hispida TaxID=260671 RepID=A0AAJ0MGU7_9PEZI|nr:hypothetical protein B0T25DRAFT_605509 [Lasiosphaeria hispida]